MTRIRADFNSVDAAGRVRSQLSRADGPVALGDRVSVYDADGHTCQATVAVLDEKAGSIALELDNSSWRDAEAETSRPSPRRRAG